MANRRFEQFSYSLVKKLTHICGSATYDAANAASLIVQDITYLADADGVDGNDISIEYEEGGVEASLAVQDITYTAVVAGPGGNSITIEYTDTATAGSETVVVTGSDVVVGIESGVSTATQVLAALNGESDFTDIAAAAITGTAGDAQVTAAAAPLEDGALAVNVTGDAIVVGLVSGVSTATEVKAAIDADVAASALISASISGTAGDAQVIAAAANLAGGDDADFNTFDIPGVASVAASGAGLIKLTLQDKYTTLMYAHASVGKASAADIVAQVAGEDVDGDKEIDFRLLAGATPTNLAVGDIVYFDIKLRNSSVL